MKLTRKNLIEYLSNKNYGKYGSEKIELDNLDWAKLVNVKNKVMVENEHDTQFELEELSTKELKIFYSNI